MKRISNISIFMLGFLLIFSSLVSIEKSYSSDALHCQGESIKYKIIWKRVSIGTAELYCNYMPESLEDAPVFITMKTNTRLFKGEEMIWGDPKDFLPIKVERNVSIAGRHEYIEEKYDQSKGQVCITKKVGSKEELQCIYKQPPIQQVILLVYYFRKKDFSVGDEYKISLPLMDVVLRVEEKEKINTPMGTFEAYRFSSKPSAFEFWISADKKRIPLRIEKAGLFLNSYMLAYDVSR